MTQEPGERRPTRLERPPSERYAPPANARADDGDASRSLTAGGGGSLARSVAFAVPAAIIALCVYVALAGPFAFSAGLVIIAIFAGRIIGLSAKAGAARSITQDRVILVALLVTLGWLVLAQVTVWLYARSEGGVLPILDYLLQTFGPIVPLVAIASVLAAWWSAG